MAAMPGPFGPLADPALQDPLATPLRTNLSPQVGGTELRSVSFSAPAGNLRATPSSRLIILSPSQQAFVDKLQAAQAFADQSTKLPNAGAPNMEVKNEPMLTEVGDVKHELNPAVGGEANMPDFHGRAHERDVSFEDHAEQMLTLSAEHDEELRSIKEEMLAAQDALLAEKLRSVREEMLARQDAMLAENQRLQRAVADYGATKLSGSDLRSRESAESRRDEYALKPLTESETKTIRFEVEPKSVRLISERLQSFLAVRNRRAFEIIFFSDEEWDEIQRHATTAEKYDPHNKWLAFTLKQLFVRPSDYTSAFEALVIGTAPISQQIDGRWIYKRMQRPIIALSSAETRALHDSFNTDTYLTPGASVVHAFSGIALLRSDFEALPPLYTQQPNALVHALLLHFAKVCPLKAEELDNDLAVDEAGGYAFKHTIDQLIALVATYTSKAKAVEISVFEGDKEAGRDRPGRDRNRGSTGAALACTNCDNCPQGGKPNHHPKNCLYRSVCFGVGTDAKPGLKGCPCGQKHATEQKVRGIGACALKWSTCPANNVYTRDGPNKKLLQGYMQGWFIRDWTLMNEKPSVPTVSVIEGSHNGLLFGNRFAENYSGAEFSVIEIEPKKCARCVEIGDPDGNWIEDVGKCGGGNSQCERRCVCKSPRDMPYAACKGCSLKFCPVHERAFDHKCATPLSAYPPLNAYVYEANVVESTTSTLADVGVGTEWAGAYNSHVKGMNACMAPYNEVNMMESTALGDVLCMRALVEASTVEINSFAGRASVEMLIDGGANMNLVQSPDIFAVAEVHKVKTSACQGAFEGMAAPMDSIVVFDGHFPQFKKGRTITFDACFVPSARRNVLSESYMWDKFGATVRKEPQMDISFGDDIKVPIKRRNGLYFADLFVTKPSTITQGEAEFLLLEIHTAESNLPYGKSVKGNQQATLWAVRFGVNARGLSKLLRATTGIGLDVLNGEMRTAIDADTFGMRARLRHAHVPTNPRDDTLLPGMLLVCDEFGPIAAPSMVDRQHKQLIAVCAATGFVHDGTGPTNTNVESWIEFVDAVRVKEKAIGNTVLRVRFDADPKLSSPDGERRFQRELAKRGIKFEVCAGGNHAANGKVEVVQDILTRKAEGWMARAKPPMGRSYFLPARRYAVSMYNLSVPSLENLTRTELHHPAGGTPDLTLVPPLLFGAKVTYVSEKDSRGPKGNLNTRAPLAQFMGFYLDKSYLLVASNGSIITRSPRDCVPLDELLRLQDGTPEAQREVVADVTDSSHSSGEGNASSTSCSSGEGSKPSAAYYPAPTPFERFADPSMRGPPSSRLSRVRTPTLHYTPVVHALENLLVSCSTPDEATHAFNCLSYYLLESDEPIIEINNTSGMNQGLADLLKICGNRQYCNTSTLEPAALEVHSIEKPKQVLVKTLNGENFVTVPKGTKAVHRDVNCESWLEADRMAVAVVLSIPLNNLVRLDEVPNGEPIVPCVVARNFKTDRVTGFAREKRAFYSRIAADGATQAAMLEKRGKSADLKRPMHAQSVDQVSVFMGVAKATLLDHEIIALDAPNAYQQGKRTRPGAYVELPATIASEYDAPDGTRMCIYFGGPIQGEIPAGDEWDASVHEVLTDLGWMAAEGVPAMYTTTDANGTVSELYKNVDEFLLMAPTDSPIIKATVDGLNDAWGSNEVLGKMKVDYNANEWRGYTFARDRAERATTIYMSNYLEAAVARHLPNMVRDKSTRPSANLPKGVTAKDVMCALKLPPAEKRETTLDKDQKKFQSVAGELVFPQPVLIRVGLAINTLLSVMCYPPRGEIIEGHPSITALFAAHLTLEAAYDARFDGITAGGPNIVDSPRLRTDLHAHLDMGESPPLQPEIMGDATWSATPFDRYAMATTYLGLLLKWQLKVLRTVADCSMGAEMHPTTEAGMQAEYIWEVARAHGMPLDAPVVIATDSLANALVSRRQGTTVKVRHQLRRWQALTARIVRGLVKVVHLPDIEMPVDFLTKWVSKKKVDASVYYLTNAANRVKHPSEPRS